MIRLILDEEEKTILLQVLDTCISDLRMEITETDNYDYKLMLKSRKAVLMKVQEALEETKKIPVAS